MVDGDEFNPPGCLTKISTEVALENSDRYRSLDCDADCLMPPFAMSRDDAMA
jgi:hypothetical protein